MHVRPCEISMAVGVMEPLPVSIHPMWVLGGRSRVNSVPIFFFFFGMNLGRVEDGFIKIIIIIFLPKTERRTPSQKSANCLDKHTSFI